MLLVFYNLQSLFNCLCELAGIDQSQINAFGAGVVTLAFIYGAYMTETFRGAFEAVPPGQVEAGRSTGMSAWLVFRLITLPQMVRFALPGYAKNLQVIIKSTALVSILGRVGIIGIKCGRASCREGVCKTV